MNIIRFTALGVAKTAGSKKSFVGYRKDGSQYVNTTDDCKDGKSWRHVVATAAVESYGYGGPLSGPLSLTVIFYLPRPKSHLRKDGTVSPMAPRLHATRPDATKLLRCIEDALKGIAWRDDAQVSIQHVQKLYGEPARAEVTIFGGHESREGEAIAMGGALNTMNNQVGGTTAEGF